MQDGTIARGCIRLADGGARWKEGSWTMTDTKGFVLTGEYVDDLREGEWTAWYPSGVVFQKVDFARDKKNGTWVQWSESGAKTFERQYKDDLQDGVSVSYGADGSVDRSVWRAGAPAP